MEHFSQKLYARLVTSFSREDGQTMAEYGVVLALITLAVVATIVLLGGQINDKLNSVVNVLKNNGSSTP
jgi:Flp pilus assembly pilin Flp